MARPGGLEPATSWFVAVIRPIHRDRPRTMKIRRLSELPVNDEPQSIPVDLHRGPSSDGVASHTASHRHDTALEACSCSFKSRARNQHYLQLWRPAAKPGLLNGNPPLLHRR